MYDTMNIYLHYMHITTVNDVITSQPGFQSFRHTRSYCIISYIRRLYIIFFFCACVCVHVCVRACVHACVCGIYIYGGTL